MIQRKAEADQGPRTLMIEEIGEGTGIAKNTVHEILKSHPLGRNTAVKKCGNL
jgi:DNA-binding IclR family transcriptional regulator